MRFRSIDDLPTPCIVVDEQIVKTNIVRMQEDVTIKGCRLRPHIKTHKSVEMAKWQIEAGAEGITVAKIGEAEVMAAGGIGDIFIAYPIIGKYNLARLVPLSRSIDRLILGVESLEGARQLSRIAVETGLRFELRLEIETGLRRTGVPVHHAAEIAAKISVLPGIRLTGIFTFRGMKMLDSSIPTDRQAAGLEEGRCMFKLAESLRQAGHNIIDVSVGSTPTSSSAASVDGVTEVRPGTYLFNDQMQVDWDGCTRKECAAHVLTRVVSLGDGSYCVVDGGSKTLSSDVLKSGSPAVILEPKNLRFDRFSEEHGIICNEDQSGNGLPLKIGQMITALPHHICTSINLHNNLFLRESSGEYRVIPVDARGCVY